ncbi:hypothetical protein CLOM_g17845 [Closterium sp. NIES-68]|nr:hypothetical protein CLOM_g17845 [Closterium sp. NIES-68]GJP60636.1 hypothetical protein CLOP_g17863 [Closterium sp. NIES-67]
MAIALRALLLTLLGILVLLQACDAKLVYQPGTIPTDSNLRGGPEGGGSQPAPSSGSTGGSGAPRCASGQTYRVKAADTCVRIVFRYYRKSFATFRSANGGRSCADLLKVGASLCLPPNYQRPALP